MAHYSHTSLLAARCPNLCSCRGGMQIQKMHHAVYCTTSPAKLSWCRYELYVASEQDSGAEEPTLTMFGQVATPFWSAIFRWEYPVQDATEQEITAVHRVFGAGVQVCAAQMILDHAVCRHKNQIDCSNACKP